MMLGDHQKRLLLGTFENLPGLGFLVLSRATGDLRLAGWIGTVLAAAACCAYAKRIMPPHPVLLGINLFMVAITPLIELLHLSGNGAEANALIGNLDSLVLGSIFVTGVVLTLIGKNGFLVHQADTPRQMRIYSAALLAVCATGIVWSLIMGDNHLVSLVVPLSLLFGLQQYLSAGASDRQSRGSAILAAPAITEPSTDTAI